MYKFVRIKPKNENVNGTWYFKPCSIEQVVEYFNTIFGKEIKAGVHDKMNSYKMSHPDTAWRYVIDSMCKVKGSFGLSWLEEAIKLENTVLNNRINDFERGLDFYLANGVQEFLPSWNMYEIVEEIEKEVLEYPIIKQLHFEDVRYMKWDMPSLDIKGVHWYAKIGNEDIRDKNGNMKWNTKEEAEEAARWFCQEYNGKHYFSF